MAKKDQKQKQAAKPKNKVAADVSQTSKLKKSAVDICIAALNDALARLEDGYLDVARLCYEATEGKYWKELSYANPGDFFFDKFGMKGRKAAYYADIHAAVVRCGLTEEQIKGIGWSKLAIIAPILDSKNMAEWLEEAKRLNYKDLVEKVAIVKGRKPRKDVKAKIELDLGEDKMVFIDNAIQSALNVIGGNSNGEALVHICTEWLQFSGASEEAIGLDSWIEYLEAKFPIKLEYEVTEEAGESVEQDESGEEPGDELEQENLDTSLLDAELDGAISEEPAPEKEPEKKTGKKDAKKEGKNGGKPEKAKSGKKAAAKMEPEEPAEDDDLLLD